MRKRGIVCPACGYDGRKPGKNGTGFRLLEKATVHWDVILDGSTAVNPRIDTSTRGMYEEDLDPATYYELECRNCLDTFRPPDDRIDPEWVDARR